MILLLIVVILTPIQATLAYELIPFGLERSGNYITQTFIIQSPAIIPLSFSYCNGFTCGNPLDPELWCYVNLYNPNFSEALPRTMSIGALPVGSKFAKPVKLYAKSGQLAGGYINYGYFDPNHLNDWNQAIFQTPPVFKNDGSIGLKFSQGPFNEFVNAKISPKGRVCGLSEEEIKGFQAKYGDVYNNPNPTFKIAVVWETDMPEYAMPEKQGTIINQILDFDTHTKNVTPQITPLPTASASTIKGYRQGDQKWAKNAAGDKSFGDAGTLPTTLANLSNLLGSTETPDQMAASLTKKNLNWEKGLTWQQMTDYLKIDKKYQIAETSSIGAATALNQGKSVLAALTLKNGATTQETVVVLKSYDAQKDQFTVFDPSRGQIQMSWQSVMQGAPWMLTVSQ